jgi:hypothetical protein
MTHERQIWVETTHEVPSVINRQIDHADVSPPVLNRLAAIPITSRRIRSR